jgi:hypothetical protein
MIRYLPSPARAARSRRNAVMIEKLLSLSFQLEPWENGFVEKLGALSSAKLPHRQEEVLQEIHDRYFPEDAQREAGQ